MALINTTKSFGIFPADIVLKSAIEEAIADIRANPWLLDYVFAYFPNDNLTNAAYGDNERQRAKDWILKTDIKVSMNYRTDDVQFPIISIGLQSSTEVSQTLGDVNYDTSEELPNDQLPVTPQIILPAFSVASYNSTTGTVTLPSNLNTTSLYPGMILVDTKTNTGYPIIDVIDDATFTIQPNVKNVSFVNAYVAPVTTFYVTSLESIAVRQNFSIKCFAEGDALYTIYLDTLMNFILLRYKEVLLEARGIDVSAISSGPLYKWSETNTENVFGRDITLTGITRSYWPKAISPTVSGVAIQGIKIIGGTATPSGLLTQQLLSGWAMEKDNF